LKGFKFFQVEAVTHLKTATLFLNERKKEEGSFFKKAFFSSFTPLKYILPRAQDRGNSMSLSQFQNPKIHSDLLQIFREFFGVHRNMGKYLRITVLEKEILEKLTACMRVTIEINTMKNKGGEVQAVLFEKTRTIRAQLENINAFTTLLWQNKSLSDGFYLQIQAKLEEVSKQVAGWQKWLASRGKRANYQK